VVVSGQFRCRDCTDCDFFLQVKTGPVIESSQDLRIGCGLVSYADLPAHMERAKLDPAVNPWDDVHDFSPGGGHHALAPGRRLELDINPIGDGLAVVFTWGTAPGRHFAVTVPRDQIPQLARASIGPAKIVRTEKRDDGNVVAVVAAESVEDARAALAGVGVLDVRAV
jgi:protein XRP2